MGSLPFCVVGRFVRCGREHAGMGQPRDTAWALRQIERNGRPMRLAHVTLARGLEEGAWRSWSVEERDAVLEPFLREGEALRHANDGEAFIVDAVLGGRGAGVAEVSGKDLETLQEDRRVRAIFDPVLRQAVASARRDAAAQAWGEATREMAPKYVQLLQLVIDTGLAEGASVADRRLAAQMVQKELDRMMGKSVAQTEDVGAGAAPKGTARDLMRSGRARALPASYGLTVEQVAEDARLELEAGVIDVDEGEM